MADAAVSHLHGNLHFYISGALRQSGDALVAQVTVHSVLVLIFAADDLVNNTCVRIDPPPVCFLSASWLDRVRKLAPQLLDLVRMQTPTRRSGRGGIVGVRPMRSRCYRISDDSTGVVQQVSTCGCSEFGSLLQALDSRCGSSNCLTGGRTARPTG
ncbi:hypothetical protein O7608_03880 [Solwaraspora sp. WMMA2056]|nr:hypothetical protein [Solwaraspora sp. WMMA2056]WJK41577.1 hypothetical protein O7608_03880 [Solwaraspora sp. WMMA2056]